MNKEQIKTRVQEEFKNQIMNPSKMHPRKDINKILAEQAQETGIVLEEKLVNMIASVIDWFKANKEDEVKFRVLENRNIGTYIYVTEVARKIEAIEYDDNNNILDQFEIQSLAQLKQYLNDKKREGYVDVERTQQIKKALRILLYGIGIAVIAAGIGSVLGPSILVVGGWIFSIIGWIGSALWGALTAGGSAVGGIGGGVVGHVFKETLQGVGILAVTTIGGWTAIKLAQKLNDEEPEPTEDW